MTKYKKTSKARQKFDFQIEPKTTTQHLFPHASRSLQWIWFVTVAFRSEEAF